MRRQEDKKQTRSFAAQETKDKWKGKKRSDKEMECLSEFQREREREKEGEMEKERELEKKREKSHSWGKLEPRGVKA